MAINDKLTGSAIECILLDQTDQNPFFSEEGKTWVKHDQITFSNSIDGLKIEFSYKGKPTHYQTVEGVRFENGCSVVLQVSGAEQVKLM